LVLLATLSVGCRSLSWFGGGTTRMTAIITPEHPATPDATALIAELDAHLEPLYPSESRHGFSVQKLIADSTPWPSLSFAMAALPLAVAASSCLALNMERSSGCMCDHSLSLGSR